MFQKIMLGVTGQHSSHHFLSNRQLLSFAFDKGQLKFHIQKDHLYSKNIFHHYYNGFVEVVFLQIVNLEM